MLPALLHRLYLGWQALLAAWARDIARSEKLETLFQQGRRVQSAATGRVYRVVCSQMGFAILVGDGGRRVIVDWLTPAGTLQLEVADNWTAADAVAPVLATS